jgi:predicted transcriptional regulator
MRVNPMGMTSVRMPDELLDRLDRTAEQLRRSKGWIIKDALEEYLAREELKQRRNQETLDSWEDYKAGRVIDGDEMMAWLESWGTEDEKEPPFK